MGEEEIGENEGGREGCRRRKGRLGIQEVVSVRMEWKGQGKARKERYAETQRRDVREDTGDEQWGEDAKKGQRF